jgi:threonine aldolase
MAEANAVFVKFPEAMETALRGRGWSFSTGGVIPDYSRLMCSWDTTPGDVDVFVADVRELAG